MMDYRSRQHAFQLTLADNRLDGFMVTHPANLRYLCGYTGSNGLLLFLGRKESSSQTAATPSRRFEEVQGARIVIAKGPLLGEAVQQFGRARSAAIGFEADHTTVTSYADMRQAPPKKFSWKPTSGLLACGSESIKDADELRIIVKPWRWKQPSMSRRSLDSSRSQRIRGRRQAGIRRAPDRR